jgi:hypothetical protein
MDNTELILSKDYKNKTIENALKLINDSSSQPINSIKTKELGFRLALTGLAEVNVKRIAHLIGAVSLFEQEIFSPEYIQELESKKVLELYKLSVDALNSAAQYVKNTSSFIGWDNLELQLRSLIIENKEIKGNEEAKKAAKDLLLMLGKMKNSNEQYQDIT